MVNIDGDRSISRSRTMLSKIVMWKLEKHSCSKSYEIKTFIDLKI